MRLSDGHVHRLAALLGSLLVYSCSPPGSPPAAFHTTASVRFSGSSLIATETNGDVTVIGNLDHVPVGNAAKVTVIGNAVHVTGTSPLATVDQIGNANAGHWPLP